MLLDIKSHNMDFGSATGANIVATSIIGTAPENSCAAPISYIDENRTAGVTW